jgi:hypothetical protein
MVLWSETHRCLASSEYRGSNASHAPFRVPTVRVASIAFSKASWPWALSAVAAQLLWIAVYRIVAAPVNAELTSQACAGSVPIDVRALQTRWDSVIVARMILMGFVVVAFAAALVRSVR